MHSTNYWWNGVDSFIFDNLTCKEMAEDTNITSSIYLKILHRNPVMQEDDTIDHLDYADPITKTYHITLDETPGNLRKKTIWDKPGSTTTVNQTRLSTDRIFNIFSSLKTLLYFILGFISLILISFLVISYKGNPSPSKPERQSDNTIMEGAEDAIQLLSFI
jgi:hypothetical protein